MVDKEWLSVIETAAYLKVHISTVYNLLTENKLPAVKLGGQWRIKKSKLVFNEQK